MSKTDGGSAYPVLTPDMNLGDTAGPGMSLRDYFAGQALSGMIKLAIENTKLTGDDKYMNGEYISQHAYDLADTMLKERDKTNDQT